MIRLITIILWVSLAHGITITPIQSRAGVYFEEVGQAELYTTEWKIITYFNVSLLHQEFDQMTELLEKIRLMCYYLPQHAVIRPLCKDTVAQLATILDRVSLKNKLLRIEGRKKRALISVVGSIAKTLFGTLNEEDALKYDSQIDSLAKEQQRTRWLMSNQTSIMEGTLNLFNKSSQTIAQNYAYLRNKLSEIDRKVVNFKDSLDQDEIAVEMESIVTLLTLIISQFQLLQDELLDLLVNAQQGRIHPSLITPTQVNESLAAIRPFLPPQVTLPEYTQSEITYKIYQISRFSAALLKARILVEMRIPLPLRDRFSVYKLYPLPVYDGRSYYFITPSTRYLLLSLHREYHFGMNSLDPSICTQTSSKRFLCRLQTPLLKGSEGTYRCELGLLSRDVLPGDCTVSTSNRSGYWFALTEPNHWIFSFREPARTDLLCGNNWTHTLLPVKGLLQLQEGCSLHTDYFTLHSTKLHSTQTNPSYLPSVDVTLYHMKNRTSGHDLETDPHPVIVRADEDLDALLKQVRQQRTELEQDVPSLGPHHVGHYSISGVITLALLITLIIWARKKFRGKERENTPSQEATPTPSATSAPSPKTTRLRFCITPPPRTTPRFSGTNRSTRF